MSKKYLSIEEAAAQIGISTAELNRLREKGTIRAFADRGTWKFKEEDVVTLSRSRQADSDPDVPLPSFGAEGGDSAGDLVFSDEDALGNQPTIIRKGPDDGGSDSDVRLIFDDSMSVPTPKTGLSPEDSDSDVKLAGNVPVKDTGSDSDVKLVTDVEPTESTGSDSDVRLVSSDSSSEVQLAGSGIKSGGLPDSAMYPGPAKDDGSSLSLAPSAEDSGVLDDDSGISLAEGSGIALASDSGISLEQPNDSGISLAEESSIVLASDSGISLAPEAPSVRSGGKKGSKPPVDSDDLTGTIPLMNVPVADGSDDILDTQMEVPMLGDSGDDSSVIEGGRGDSTSVITLDEDEDEYSVTGDSGDDLFADDDAVVEDDEAVEVSDEIVGEDDELSEDVFGAEDEDFAGDVESGESLSGLPVATGRGVAAPVEQEWGTPTFVGLTISAILMVACGTVMFDLVRNIWLTSADRQNPVSSMLLDMVKGIGA
jgi:excisionase family DNA binding protein